MFFSSIEDENNWSVKQGDDRYKDFLGQSEIKLIANVQMSFGLGKVITFGIWKVDDKQRLD